MNGADVQIAVLHRESDGTRVAVRLLRREGAPGLEIAVEARRLDGWELKKRVVLTFEELPAFARAVARAFAIAGRPKAVRS